MPRWNKAIGIMVGMAVMFAASAAAQNSTKSSKLTIEQLIEIKHPSNPVWSPDGKHVVFTWDRAGVGNLYVANADGHGQPQALTSFPEGQVEGDRKSTRLNSSHRCISYAVFCLKKKKK